MATLAVSKGRELERDVRGTLCSLSRWQDEAGGISWGQVGPEDGRWAWAILPVPLPPRRACSGEAHCVQPTVHVTVGCSGGRRLRGLEEAHVSGDRPCQ